MCSTMLHLKKIETVQNDYMCIKSLLFLKPCQLYGGNDSTVKYRHLLRKTVPISVLYYNVTGRKCDISSHSVTVIVGQKVAFLVEMCIT